MVCVGDGQSCLCLQVLLALCFGLCNEDGGGGDGDVVMMAVVFSDDVVMSVVVVFVCWLVA